MDSRPIARRVEQGGAADRVFGSWTNQVGQKRETFGGGRPKAQKFNLFNAHVISVEDLKMAARVERVARRRLQTSKR